jgi:ankyrin repeat protein
MSDALPFPPRPNLQQYRKVAKDLQHACQSSDLHAIREWAARLIDRTARLQGIEITPHIRAGLDRASERIERRWAAFKQEHARGSRCLLADAQYFVAVEHGFASWPRFAAHIETLTRQNSPVSNFEKAVDAIVSGDAATLRTLLRAQPYLAHARSTRDHRSTLLHYVSANGVEDFRQRTPNNIVEITKILLDAGADVNAESDAYGGQSTALGLAATSVHPEQAGVQIALLETLLEYGADINRTGLTGNRHAAVKGCLANGQGRAAVFFANRGAVMDLEEAAGVGRLDLVKSFFDEDGQLKAVATREQMESGFLYACGYGRDEIVRFLLDKGVNPGWCDKSGETGLHWASYGPHVAVVRLLLQYGAPVNQRDKRFQSTPLDWALHAWATGYDAEERERGYEMIALLVRAGAKSDPQWLDRRGPDTANKILSDPRMMAALRGEILGTDGDSEAVQ